MDNKFNNLNLAISKLRTATEDKQKRPTLHKARIDFIKSNEELFSEVVNAVKAGVSKSEVVNILNSLGATINEKPLKFEVRDITGVLAGVKGIKTKKRAPNKEKA